MAYYSTFKTQMDIQPICFWEQQQLPVSGWNVTIYICIKILVLAYCNCTFTQVPVKIYVQKFVPWTNRLQLNDLFIFFKLVVFIPFH